VTSDDLAAVLRAADPGRPALAQLLAATSVGTSTAYRYLDQARRLGLVEVRAGRLYPARR
jgi:DNA-binding IclR family transcriptional regulator